MSDIMKDFVPLAAVEHGCRASSEQLKHEQKAAQRRLRLINAAKKRC